MAEDNNTGGGNENPTPEEGDKGDKGAQDTNTKPPLQAIAVSTGVIAVAAAAAAAKYLAS